MPSTPLIGVSACLESGPRTEHHVVRVQYVDAVTDGMGACPVILPAIGNRQDVAALVGRIDGLLLTGSPSNVDPAHYGADARPGMARDPARDATTLPLIRAALARGLPVLALCRGHQELNVALGGSLHQNLGDLPGRFDHSPPTSGDNDLRYAHRHWVDLVPGGLLAGLAGSTRAFVNSLHLQAVDRPGEGLAVEATHEDGTIEAVRWTRGPGFALGLQWHPEWHVRSDAFAKAIFGRFARAVGEHLETNT
jgi:putative glutamine amidotransferase